MSFPDTGPDEEGRRTAAQWLNAIREDAGIIQMQLGRTLRDERDRPLALAAALKEARRLQSDIYRFAKEVHGITREQIDAIGPL